MKGADSSTTIFRKWMSAPQRARLSVSPAPPHTLTRRAQGRNLTRGSPREKRAIRGVIDTRVFNVTNTFIFLQFITSDHHLRADTLEGTIRKTCVQAANPITSSRTMCSGADSSLGPASQTPFGSGPAIHAGNLSFYQPLKITCWVPPIYTSLSSAFLTKTAIHQTCLLLSLNLGEPYLIRCDQNATFLVMECAPASTTCHSLWTSNPLVRFLCPRQPWRHVLQTLLVPEGSGFFPKS